MTVAGFDTSGDSVDVTLLQKGMVVATHCEERRLGQSEALFPSLARLLAECGADWPDLATIGVCTGPGFFNGIRIAIAAARGLALALRVPAVGLDRFATMTLDVPGPALAVLAMPDGQTCCRMTNETEAFFATPDTIVDHAARPRAVVGHEAAAFAAALASTVAEPLYSPSLAVALAAHRRLGQPSPIPTPYYVNPPRVHPDARRFARPS